MNALSPSVDESITARKLFKHKSGRVSEMLRLKEGETLEEGVTRLRLDGWEIPDLAQVTEENDASGRMLKLK